MREIRTGLPETECTENVLEAEQRAEGASGGSRLMPQ